MNFNMPRTPLSTRLSKSTRETEVRIRNIFSGPKKRPPVLLMALIVLAILLCGNLVAFRRLPARPTVVMETQYYDGRLNYIEIPALALPAGEKNEAVDAINAALNDLRRQYSSVLTNASEEGIEEEQCLFYPSTTDRHLNLLFFRKQFTTDLSTGHVLSLVYDLKKGELVFTEDALARAGLNEKALLDQVTEQMEPEMNPAGQEYKIALHNLTLEGFRMKADGQPVFYLTGRLDDADDSVLDAVSGGEQLFIWDNRATTIYGELPLVPSGETDRFDPPLWNQWNFSSGVPKGGFSPFRAQIAADLRAVLLGNMTFTDGETGLALDIGRVTEAVSSDTSFTARAARFACLDLDKDINRTEDVVLWLETEEGDPALAFIILHWQGEGQVYGYTRFPRYFDGLKKDGTFSFSSSAVDFGVGKLMFSGVEEGVPAECYTWDLALQERVDSDWDNLTWHVDGTPATQAEFDAAWEEYCAKENAVWYELTPENIERII